MTISISRKNGFTLVELLIVIVVIAILAAITLVAYNGVQDKAHASTIVSDLKATEKAFKLYQISSGTNSWWPDNDSALTGAINPSIASIIAAQPGFANYLQTAPATTGLGAGSNQWFYDNDSDTYNGCSATTSGVNLAINGATDMTVMQDVDNVIDDGNLSCGKIRYVAPFFVYTLSNGSSG